jgi:hypothetical protein
MKRTRILLAGMPMIMLEFMKTIFTSHPDLYVAQDVPADRNLSGVVRRYRADVLILMQPDHTEDRVMKIFSCRPSKVLVITEDGRKGLLYLLRPHVKPLDDLSVENLIHAIRAERQSE